MGGPEHLQTSLNLVWINGGMCAHDDRHRPDLVDEGVRSANSFGQRPSEKPGIIPAQNKFRVFRYIVILHR
jgi:hypothetical protein